MGVIKLIATSGLGTHSGTMQGVGHASATVGPAAHRLTIYLHDQMLDHSDAGSAAKPF